MGVKGSVYLNDSSRVKATVKPTRNFLAVFTVALFALLLGTQSSITSALSQNSARASQTASAGTMGMLCGGSNDVVAANPSSWKDLPRYYPASDATNRKWTLDEAYGAGLSYPIYTGEGGESTFLVTEAAKDRGKGVGNWDESLSKLKTVRTAHNCTLGWLGVILLGDGLMMIDRAAISLVNGLTTIVFDSSVVCKDASAKNQGNCVNLLGIIGGTNNSVNADGTMGSGTGIIGKLTNGVYLPLITLVVLGAAAYVVWLGIVKRKLREALGAFVWVFLSAIIGLTFLYKPTILSRAPMALSNNISACIIGGYAGHSCLDGSGSTTIDTTSDMNNSDKVVCLSKANTSSADQEMSLIMNTMTCRIWKAFVLEPYSEGNFGRNFEEMDVANPDTKKAIEKAKLKPEDFCVAMTSSKSVNQQGSVLEMDSAADKICNVAAYQMFLQTKAKDTSGDGTTYNDTTKGASEVNKDWYKVALYAAADDGVWSHWTPGESEAMHKAFLGFMSFICIVAGTIVIAAIAAFAFIYYLTSLFLMAFAPLFFLLGIHPGRGKAILIGWGETVLENVFKYIASAMFLVVTVALYDAVLSNLKNLGLTFLFVILLSIALFYYRKEIVNLIGKVNMGGKRLSNKVEEKIAPRLKRATYATAGGAVGAAWTNGLSASNFMHGAKQGMKRDLMRDRKSFIGATLGERERMINDNKRDLLSHAKDYDARASEARDDKTQNTEKLQKAQAMSTTDRENMEAAKEKVEDTTSKIEQQNSVKADVLLNAEGLDETFRKMQALTNELATLGLQRQMAMALGDMAEVDRIDARMVDLTGERDAMLSAMDRADLDRNLALYQDNVRLEMGARGLDDDDLSAEFASATRIYATARERFIDDMHQVNLLERRDGELDHQITVNTGIARQLNKDHRDLRDGEKLSGKEVLGLVARAESKNMYDMPEFKGNDIYDASHTGLPMLSNLYDDSYKQRLDDARNNEEPSDIISPDPTRIQVRAMGAYTRVNEPIDVDPFVNMSGPENWNMDNYSVGFINPSTGQVDTTLDVNEGSFMVNGDKTINFAPAPDFVGTTPAVEFAVSTNDGSETSTAPMKVTVGDPMYLSGNGPDRERYNTGDRIKLSDQGNYTSVNTPIALDPFVNSHLAEDINLEDLKVHLRNNDGDELETLVTPEGTFQVNEDKTVTFSPAQDYVGESPAVDVTAATLDGSDMDVSQMKVVVSERKHDSGGDNGNPSGGGGNDDQGPTGGGSGGNDSSNGGGGNPQGGPRPNGGDRTPDRPMGSGGGIPIPNSNPEAKREFNNPVPNNEKPSVAPDRTPVEPSPAPRDDKPAPSSPREDNPAPVAEPVRERENSAPAQEPVAPVQESPRRESTQDAVVMPAAPPRRDPAPQAPAAPREDKPTPVQEPAAPAQEPARREPAQDRTEAPAPQRREPAPQVPVAPRETEAAPRRVDPAPVKQDTREPAKDEPSNGYSFGRAAGNSTQEPVAPVKAQETPEVPKNWGTVDGNASVTHESKVRRPQAVKGYTAQPRPRDVTLGRTPQGDIPTPRKKDAANFFDLGEDS